MEDTSLAQALEHHLGQAPRILEEQSKKTPRLEDGVGECVLASGSGDSLAAALTLQHALPFETIALDPSDALETPWLPRLARQCTLLALSVGGRTVTLVKLAERYRERGGRVIAVTADPRSPLAHRSHIVIELVEGRPSGGVGGVRHLAMLTALARALSPETLPPWSTIAKNPGGPCPRLSEPQTFIGTGPSRGTAYYASLKSNEVFGTPNPSTSLEEVLHAQAFALPRRYHVFHAPYQSPEAGERARTTLETLSLLGEATEWRPLETPLATAIHHSYHLLRCLATEARARNVQQVVYKTHPRLPELTRAIYGDTP